MKPGNRHYAAVPIPTGFILKDEEHFQISSLRRDFLILTAKKGTLYYVYVLNNTQI